MHIRTRIIVLYSSVFAGLSVSKKRDVQMIRNYCIMLLESFFKIAFYTPEGD